MDDQPVALREAERGETRGEALDLGEQLRSGQRAGPGLDDRRVRTRRERSANCGDEAARLRRVVSISRGN